MVGFIGLSLGELLCWFITLLNLSIRSRQDESESTLVYYSTAPQLYQLVSALDSSYYEYGLCLTINQRIEDILDQVRLLDFFISLICWFRWQLH